MLRGPFTCLQHMWLTRHEARREERRSRTAVGPAFAEGLERRRSTHKKSARSGRLNSVAVALYIGPSRRIAEESRGVLGLEFSSDSFDGDLTEFGADEVGSAGERRL